MIQLTAASAFFVMIHLLISGTSFRDVLVRRIGEGAYMGLFSLLSVAGLTWMIFAYGQARTEEWNTVYWGVGAATRHIQILLQLVAFLFVVIGLTTPNPTSVKQEGVLQREDAVKGMLRITRHPFLWGVAIWAIGHLIVNGDRAGMTLFGTLLVLALAGTTSIDAKRRRALGATWEPFATQTSNIPFAAILAGRQSLRLGEIGLWRPLAALAVYAILLVGHPHLFGVPALP
ncbi:MAG: NnrU family protein [Phenylobacterium sp.]|uniref:NnrU family protein n=1 Tax=Phenylobacterium sp. TaxID=1871053 RepID=UPI0027256BB0|nr:NnrU family protein [Phenylobacterium sp.]MDO8902778.1 NnrU family protein [Phenylobacterium sp.]MDP2212335.1 NnrU family protein [Phenylobacterium sp.]